MPHFVAFPQPCPDPEIGCWYTTISSGLWTWCGSRTQDPGDSLDNVSTGCEASAIHTIYTSCCIASWLLEAGMA
eukprot:scaffold265292_cov39-Prasinocladus_malaysianus.AAC.3